MLMEGNNVRTSQKKSNGRQAGTFKDILVNASNDDVIVPISATFDKAVLHIGIGKRTGVSIEKPEFENGKDLLTSCAYATRHFSRRHLLEDNVNATMNKNQRQKGERSWNSLSRWNQDEQKYSGREQLPCIFIDDADNPLEAAELSEKSGIERSKVKANINQSDEFGKTSPEAEFIEAPFLKDSLSTNLKEMVADDTQGSKDCGQDLSLSDSPCSTPSEIAGRECIETLHLCYAPYHTNSNHLKSPQNLANTLSEKRPLNETRSQVPLLIPFPDAVKSVSNFKLLTQADFLNIHDISSGNLANETPDVPEGGNIDRERCLEVWTTLAGKELKALKEPLRGKINNTARQSPPGDILTNELLENRLPETKFPTKGALPSTDVFRDYGDFLTDLDGKSEHAKAPVQYVPHQISADVTTRTVDMAVKTETRPVDQISSLCQLVEIDAKVMAEIHRSDSEEVSGKTRLSKDECLPLDQIGIKYNNLLSSESPDMSKLTTSFDKFGSTVNDVRGTPDEVDNSGVIATGEVLPVKHDSVSLELIDFKTAQYGRVKEIPMYVDVEGVGSSETEPVDDMKSGEISWSFDTLQASGSSSNTDEEVTVHESASEHHVATGSASEHHVATGTASTADVSLSDIETNLAADESNDCSSDDDVLGIMSLYKGSGLHCAVTNINGSKMTTIKEEDFGYMYFSLSNFIYF